MKILTLTVIICLITINLPKAQTDGGKPLIQALKMRKSSREFNEKELPQQILSNLLWAAVGINRPDSGKFTAPAALNMREIDIFLALKDGLYLYSPKQHTLTLVLKEDIRSVTGEQEFAATAPVNLIYTADYSRMSKIADEKDFYSATDAGFIAQNVYLYCASEDLATVIRGWIDKEALRKKMNLGPEQKIILAQTVGYLK